MINTHNVYYIHRAKRRTSNGHFYLYSKLHSFKRNGFTTVYKSSKYSGKHWRNTFLNTYVWSDIDMINLRS